MAMADKYRQAAGRNTVEVEWREIMSKLDCGSIGPPLWVSARISRVIDRRLYHRVARSALVWLFSHNTLKVPLASMQWISIKIHRFIIFALLLSSPWYYWCGRLALVIVSTPLAKKSVTSVYLIISKKSTSTIISLALLLHNHDQPYP